MKKVDPKYYESVAAELLAKVGRLNHFTTHRPSIGAFHEAVLRTAIRQILSERFAIRTGFTFSEDMSLSRQFDILIIDESEPSSYFFKEGDFVVVHPDCVACAIEVKTMFSKEAFIGAAENIYSLKRASEVAECKYITPGIVFAYDGPEFTPERLHDWYRDVKVPDEMKYYPDTILCLTKGRIDCVRDDMFSARPGARCTLGEPEGQPKAKSLSVFLAFIRKFMEVKAGKDGNPFVHADIEGLQWTAEYFRYGKGMLDANGQPVTFKEP